MRIINDRYEVERTISTGDNISSFLVYDNKSNDKYVLNVVETKSLNDKVDESLFSKIPWIKNLNFAGVVNFYDYLVIENIDGVKIEGRKFAYLTEYVSENSTKIVDINDVQVKLDIFANILIIINTLILNAYLYEKLDYENIYYLSSGEVKLRDILSLEIDKLSISSNSMDSNIEFNDESKDSQYNLNEIAHLFYSIFEKDILIENNKDKRIFLLYKKLMDNSFSGIEDIIDYINSIFNKGFRKFNYDDLNKVNTELSVIGREYEINKFIQKLNDIVTKKLKFSITAINGERGSGKTKLLDYFRDIIYSRFDENVFIIQSNSLIDFNMSFEENKERIFEFLRPIWDKNQKEKYSPFVSEFLDLIINEEDNYKEEKKNSYLKVINRVIKFLVEIAKNKVILLFIEDLENRNYIVKMFLKYVCLSEISLENFLIVLTYNESKIKASINVEKLIGDFRNSKDYDEYKLNYLNEYDTRKLIKNMLNTTLELYDFSSKIYKETLGNPMYIISIVKELYEQKILYISEKTGKWKERLKDRDIPFPEDLEAEIKYELEGISDVSYEIIRKLSIINYPIEEDFLYSFGILNKENYKEFNMLIIDDYVGERISDRGLLYGINNNLMKKIVYREISSKEKNQWHRTMVDFLEREISNGNLYEDELIYQLEILEEYDKFVKLCRKCGDSEFKDWNNNRAIYYYNRALESKHIGKGEYSDITLKLADLYYRDGNIDESLNYYKKVLYVNEEKEVKCYCYARIAAIAYRVESPIFIEQYFEECKNLLDELDYIEGEVAYYLAQAKYNNFKGNYEEAIKIGSKAIDIADDKFDDLVAYIYICLGDAYTNINTKDKSIECFKRANNLFNKTYNLRGIISTDINMGHYFFRVEENFEEALKYLYKAQKSAHKREVEDLKILSDISISEIYINERRYKEAFELLKKALNVIKSNGLEYYKVLAYFYLGKCCLKMGKLQLAHKYLEMGKEKYKRYNSEEIFLKSASSIIASYYYSINNFNEAWEIIDACKDIGEGYESHIISRINCEHCLYNLRRCSTEYEIRNEIEVFMQSGKNIKDEYFKVDLLLDFIIELQEIGYNIIAKELYEGFQPKIKDNRLMLKYRYIQLFFDLDSLNKIHDFVELLNYIEDKKLSSRVCIKIGEIDEKKEDFIKAIENYYKALIISNKEVKTLPKAYKLSYINNGVIIRAYNKIVRFLNLKLGIYKLKEKNEFASIQEFEELMNELDVESLIKNKEFFKSLSEDFEKNYFAEFSSIYDVLNEFKSDIKKDIENLTKYMCKVTLAESAIITMQDSEGLESIIYDYRAINPRTKVEFFKSKLAMEEEGKVARLNLNKFNINEEELLSSGVKAAIYIRTKNKISIEATENIQGSVILYSNKYLNNINEDSLEKVKPMIPLLGFLLDKYHLTINSTLDKLTNVYNRKFFEASLLDILENSKTQKQEFSVAIFDIDNFKGVNDKYGHHFGDRVLTSVATIAKNTIGKDDVIGRYGGEEFVILFPGKNQNEAFKICESFRKKIQKSSLLGNSIEFTISIGLAQYPIHSMSSENLIKMADEALYVAKNSGKNKTIIWNNEFGNSSQLNNKLAGILSGNTVNDYRKLSAIMDIIDLVRKNVDNRDKIYEFLTRVMEVSEAQESTLFILEDNIFIDEYSRKRYEDGWQKAVEINYNMTTKVIESKVGTYLVDWDSGNEEAENSWIPNWKSILIVPIIYNGLVKGVVYLSVSINDKEFNNDDLNFVNTLAGIFAAII